VTIATLPANRVPIAPPVRPIPRNSTKRLVHGLASLRVRANRGIHAALIAVVAMWGLVFVAIARLLHSIDPVQLVVIRFTLIALVFAGVFVVLPDRRPRLDGWRDWALFAVIGVIAVPGSQLTIVNGQRYLSPPLVSLVVTTSPAFAAIIAAIWLKERIVSRQVLGFCIALFGVAIVILAGSGSSTLSVDNPWGAALTVLSPMSWAVYTVLTKTLTGRFDPVAAIGLAMIAGSLSMLPLYPHAVAGLGDITATGWAWMAFLVVGGTVIPYLVWWRALGHLTAATTTAYMYGIPLAALVWSWAILGIVPSAVALLGGAVIIAGVAMIQFARRAARPVDTSVPQEVPA
jgi:drug/metabolite transporter (DMT)-like permease